MKKLFKTLFLTLLLTYTQAGPIGGDNVLVLSEDDFEQSDFDVSLTYEAKTSAVGAYTEVSIDAPMIRIASPHLDGVCGINFKDSTASNISFQNGICRDPKYASPSGDSTTPDAFIGDKTQMAMYLGTVDPYNKEALDLADTLLAGEEASINCSVIKKVAGETDTLAMDATSLWDDNGHIGDDSQTYATVEQGFDCRVAKKANGDVVYRLRGLSVIRFIARNLPPVQVDVKNGDLVYHGGTVAVGAHTVNDIRLVQTTYDASADGDGVSSGKHLSSVGIGTDSVSNFSRDALMLIDYEFDVETLKSSASSALAGSSGTQNLTSDFAAGEVELEYTFETI